MSERRAKWLDGSKASDWFPARLTEVLYHGTDFINNEQLYYIGLSLGEKRKLYACGYSFVTLDKIPTWAEESKEYDTTERDTQSAAVGEFLPNSTINKKVSLWLGDITRLEIDAVVSAAVPSQIDSGVGPSRSVRTALHKAAGPMLEKECKGLGSCSPGDAKVTFGYNLPAKLVIHAVQGRKTVEALAKCYQSCFDVVSTYQIASVAFCCIGTGGLEFSKEDAAHFALKTSRKWLEVNSDKVERIIFCTYTQTDWDIYDSLLRHYFPPHRPAAHASGALVSSQISEAESETERAQRNNMERLMEKEKARAEAIEQRLKLDMEKMEQVKREKEREISRLNEVVHHQENRIHELEQAVAASREREAQIELQLSNSDRMFQDILHRLLGQLPQSQPHWVVQRNEIQLTDEQLGTGGWATVKVALFRGQRVAAKCLHNQIISAHNIRLFTRDEHGCTCQAPKSPPVHRCHDGQRPHHPCRTHANQSPACLRTGKSPLTQTDRLHCFRRSSCTELSSPHKS